MVLINETGMGTALQHAVDLLATLPKNNPSDAVNNSNDKELYTKTTLNNTLTGSQQFLHSMDKIFEQCNKESMRITILKHEKIFKEQVKELHRLYKVQKMLMAELRNNQLNHHTLVKPTPLAIRVGTKCIDMPNHTGFWSPGTSSEANHFLFGNWTQPNNSNFLHPYNSRIDLSSQEQSSSCSRDTLKTPRRFDLELPAEENNSTDISTVEDHGRPSSMRSPKDKRSTDTSRDSCLYGDGEADVELTLSIGVGSGSKKKPSSSRGLGCSLSNAEETRQVDPSMPIRLDPGEEYSSSPNGMGRGNPMFDRESLQQPSWLFQTLRLNGT